MVDSLSNDDLLSTTRVVRRRLDLTRRVPRAVVEECLALAVQAPTASNRQEWHWVFVDDPEQVARLAECYRRAPKDDLPLPAGGWLGREANAASNVNLRVSHDILADNLHRAPLILVPCHLGRVDDAPVARQAALWGSLYPAVWNLLLALRTRGLVAAWTTAHLTDERAAARILSIPYERYTQGGMFPIAFPLGGDFTRAARRPVSEIVHWNTW
jgi:nitroreductase